MSTRNTVRIRFNGRDFLDAGLNVTDNPLIVKPNEMVDSTNILVGSTLARRPRGGQAYFNTDDSDEGATYPDNPKNTIGGVDGDPILGIYEFWRYDSVSGLPKTTLMVRQGTKIWAIAARTGVATDITGALTLPTTGRITFQAFEGKVYWVNSNTTEGYNCWDGISATATAIVNVAATFDAAITGVTGNVELTADTAGTIGNAILLTGDGAKTLTTLVSDWNTANPTNTVTLDSANGADVPAAAQAMQLAGGLNNLPPDGTPGYIVSHLGRMWAFGVVGFPYRLYYSSFYNATEYATADFGASGLAAEPGSLDLDPFGDPSGINGAVSFQNRLYVFMQRSQFEIQGNTINNFQVNTLNRQIGCIGHHTIVPVGNDVIYASERGILKMSSTDKAIQSEYGFASRPISRLWNESLNRGVPLNYSATYDEQDNLYLLSATSEGNTTNDTILALNVQNMVWSVWDGHKARSLATYVIGGINRVIAGREDGIISVLGEESRLDLGLPFSRAPKFKTGFVYPGEEIDLQYIWRHATILASSDGKASITLNAYVDTKLVSSIPIEIDSGRDLLGSTFVLGQSALGQGVFVPETISLEGQGYGLQLEVVFNTSTDVEIFGFMVECIKADSPTQGG